MKLLATRKRRRWALAIVTLLGVLLLLGAEWVGSYRSPQVSYYNQGIELANQGDVDGAIAAFDKSIGAYKQAQDHTGMAELLLPGPSLEYAALAHKQRGILFILKQKPDQAVLAFKESLKLNPGDSYPAGISASVANRLREQAYVVKYDLELLFKKNPEQAKGEGKGKPQEGDGQGQPKPAPGNDPGKLPGKGNRDDI
jgi:tetratricopeptide (TPR) repeat protein